MGKLNMEYYRKPNPNLLTVLKNPLLAERRPLTNTKIYFYFGANIDRVNIFGFGSETIQVTWRSRELMFSDDLSRGQIKIA